MSALLTTLPGNIPGLLQRGSPLWVRGAQTVAVVLYDGRVAYATKGGLNHDALGAVELDLNDPTGRAHAAWWVRSIIRWPETDQDDELLTCAEKGADMNDYQIDTLARLVLRLAGRAP